jgi:hypothetical protein
MWMLMQMGDQNFALFTLLIGKAGEASSHIQYSVSSPDEGFV